MSNNNTEQELREEIEALQSTLKKYKDTCLIFQAIMDHSPALISAKDLEGNVIMTNNQFKVLDGPAPEAYIGKNVFDLFPKDIAQALWENDQLAAKEMRSIESEETVFHKDKSKHVYHTVKFPLVNEHDQLFATCAFSIDITNSKRAEENSIKDVLTGLYNRRYFNDRFETEIKRAERDSRPFVFFMMDVDNLKQYNDQFGHKQGDTVLEHVGKTLQESFNRPGDILFRLGGDEFACVMSCDDLQSVDLIAEKVRSRLESHTCNCALNGSATIPTSPTMSIGIFIKSPFEKYSSDEIYNGADQALYAAKTAGRNQIVVSNPRTPDEWNS